MVMIAFADTPRAGPSPAPRDWSAPRIWFHDAYGRLGVLDVESGAVLDKGPMSAVLTDLAFAPDGRLYGISFDRAFEVAADGGLTDLGPHGVPCGNALEIAPDGAAYAMGCSSGGLYALDLHRGLTRKLFETGHLSAGDLAWRDGALLLAARGLRSNILVALDPRRGDVREVGAFGVDHVYGLASTPDGRLYAGADTRYFEVDPSSGRALRLGDTAQAGFGPVYGWAIEPGLDQILAAIPAAGPAARAGG